MEEQAARAMLCAPGTLLFLKRSGTGAHSQHIGIVSVICHTTIHVYMRAYTHMHTYIRFLPVELLSLFSQNFPLFYIILLSNLISYQLRRNPQPPLQVTARATPWCRRLPGVAPGLAASSSTDPCSRERVF